MRYTNGRGKNMPEFKTVDRQGKVVIVKQLPDNRLVFVWQDGYLEKREIIKIQK